MIEYFMVEQMYQSQTQKHEATQGMSFPRELSLCPMHLSGRGDG